MEWSEFTGYCVEAGFVATRRSVAPMTHTFYHDSDYLDRTSKGEFIRDMQYNPNDGNVYVVGTRCAHSQEEISRKHD